MIIKKMTTKQTNSIIQGGLAENWTTDLMFLEFYAVYSLDHLVILFQSFKNQMSNFILILDQNDEKQLYLDLLVTRVKESYNELQVEISMALEKHHEAMEELYTYIKDRNISLELNRLDDFVSSQVPVFFSFFSQINKGNLKSTLNQIISTADLICSVLDLNKD